MDENTQPEANSDELIMQQQRQIEKEVIYCRELVCGFVFVFFFFLVIMTAPHLPILQQMFFFVKKFSLLYLHVS